MAWLESALGPVRSSRYLLERELGRGGMATVYLARDLAQSRQVALKVLRPEVAAALGPERFLREIRLTAQLQHPHILGLLDSGEAAGCLYYTMPYVAGESLRARLTREPQLPVDEAVRIAAEVAGALAYAHAQGVVHRDVKPENILLESREAGARALVADFGIAQALSVAGGERLTATGLAVGTPAYMSPEQASGSRVDRRSDLYSLGCVLYEMLGGEPPYTGPTGQAILAKRLKEPLPHLRTLRPEIPDAVDHAVTRALAKSPADRFATAADFAAALAPAAVVPTVKLPRWRGRRRAGLVVGILLVAAVVASSAVRLRHRAPAAAPAVSAAARRVVVAVFANNTGDSALDPLGDVVADYLARGLAETMLVEVIDARTEPAADARARDLAGARALARTLGAGRVLWGAYARRGDSLRFEAQLSDAATGKPLAAIPPAMGAAARQTQGVEALRQRVMVTLAARLYPGFDSAVNGPLPASYEAYREFMAAEAIGACPLGRDCVAEAFAHYRQAHALDSTDSNPLVGMAALSYFTGACARTDSIAEVLRPRYDSLPPFNRNYLDWVVASCHGQPATVLEAARQVMLAAPRTDLFVLRYAFVVRRSGRLREAIALIEGLDRARNQGDLTYWGNLVIPYHLLGEYQRELELAQEARKIFPANLEVLRWQAHALVGLGRVAEVDTVVDEMARVPLEVKQDALLSVQLDYLGRDLRAHGYRQDAQAVFERGIRWTHAVSKTRSPTEQRELRLGLAALLYDTQRWDDARQVLQELAGELPDDIGVQARVGAVAAHRGDLREVARIDRWLANRKDLYLRGEPAFERARLAAILGERDRALELFRQALDQAYALNQGGYGIFHPDPDFEALRDDPLFQELTRPKD